MINFERALHWLQRRWWGLIVAHLIILVGTFSTIWVFIEPMGIPDSFGRLDDLPGLLRQRFFYHIVFTLLIGAYLTLILDLISRKKMKRLLVNRRELPRLEDMINGAKKEIWISGIALDRVSTLTGLLNLRIRDGVRLRLLALDPEIGNVAETSEYFGVDASELEGRLRANLDTLAKRLVRTEPSSVEMRVVHHRPSSGYFIVDPNLAEGYATMVTYLCKIQGTDIPPMSLLSRRIEPDLFELYLRDFEIQWNHATKWVT